MTLVLRWRKPEPPIALRWRGLDAVTASVLAAAPGPTPLAAIVGPPGRDGSGFLIVRQAGMAIGGHCGAAIDADDRVALADPIAFPAIELAGVTIGAVEEGASASVQAGGELREDAWAWQPGPIWLGANGVLTQAVPTSGALWRVGTAIGPTAIRIQPELVAIL